MEREKIVNKYRDFFKKIKGNNHFYRLGKPFKTTNKFYFYDMGTGKVFQLRKSIYELMEK